MPDELEARLSRIRQAIAQAARGREVTLVAASKFQPLGHIQRLYQLGVTDFGENYPQALVERVRALKDGSVRPRWHLLGGLQRNKAALVAPVLDVLHSLDDVRLAEALSRAHGRAGRQQPIDVFVQLACDGLPTATSARRGVSADDVAEVVAAVRELPGLRLVGLMALPPRTGDPVPSFVACRRLRDRLAAPGGPLGDARALSMGMSVDFSLAIAEGATVVRLGSALFGPRPAPA